MQDNEETELLIAECLNLYENSEEYFKDKDLYQIIEKSWLALSTYDDLSYASFSII